MNENLDLTKILKGCPKGTEFYHAGYGRVWLARIFSDTENIVYPIVLSFSKKSLHLNNVCVTAKGTLDYGHEGECLLFPSKDQRDWSKFVRFWDKPKVERFDIKTMKPFDKALVRCHTNDKWAANFFVSCDSLNDVGGIECMNLYASQCIPYNDKTKHLLGTKEDCPEYYKWWDE